MIFPFLQRTISCSSMSPELLGKSLSSKYWFLYCENQVRLILIWTSVVWSWWPSHRCECSEQIILVLNPPDTVQSDLNEKVERYRLISRPHMISSHFEKVTSNISFNFYDSVYVWAWVWECVSNQSPISPKPLIVHDIYPSQKQI